MKCGFLANGGHAAYIRVNTVADNVAIFKFQKTVNFKFCIGSRKYQTQ
jgi:hypothetical protein